MSIVKIKKRFDVDGYIVYGNEDEMTYCSYCKKPILYGMTDKYGDCYVHEECFDNYMNDTYGKGKWKSTDDDGNDGYYLYLNDIGKWEGTGIFYTEWWDDYDADFNYDKNRIGKYDFYVNRTEGIIDYMVAYTGTSSDRSENYKYFYPTEDKIEWTID